MADDDVLVVWSESGDLDDDIHFEDWGEGTPRLRSRADGMPYFDDAVEAASFLMVNVRVQAQVSTSAARDLMPDLAL